MGWAARSNTVSRNVTRPLGSHNRKLTREDLDTPMLGLLLGGRPKMLHAGVVRGPRPGNALCNDKQMFQHPLFARDPNFGPGLPVDVRHAYALAALRINTGSTCYRCSEILVEIGGDLLYPWIDPHKAQ